MRKKEVGKGGSEGSGEGAGGVLGGPTYTVYYKLNENGAALIAGQHRTLSGAKRKAKMLLKSRKPLAIWIYGYDPKALVGAAENYHSGDLRNETNRKAAGL